MDKLFITDLFGSPNGQSNAEGELSLLSPQDKKIWEEIHTSHALSGETFDDDSLFIIVENIIKRATQDVDKKVQGIQMLVDDMIEDRIPKANFSVPLCTLKGILCGMQCKSPGDQIAHDAAVAILKKLSKFSWEAKASLTLAAFAMEYGEFWLLAQHRESDPLAKSIAVLKRVLKSSEVAKRSQSVIELNNLIKVTLGVIECIDKLNKHSKFNYDSIAVRDLSKALLVLIPVDVYWVIITVVACATKMTILTRDEDMEYNLANYSGKMNYILQNLTTHLKIFETERVAEETYKWINSLFQYSTEITVVFKGLIFPKDNLKPLIKCSTRPPVNVDNIKQKNVFLFVSRLDINQADIEIVHKIHEFITKNHDEYMIIWIPIVEQWTADLQNKFDSMQREMPWFTVQLSGHIAGLRYIKNDWHFKGVPMMVVMNPQGRVVHSDALQMIRFWGVRKAFPFTKTKQEDLLDNQGHDWIGTVVKGTRHPNLPSWIAEESFVIFYGGRDNLWIQRFEKKAEELRTSPTFKELKIQLQLVYVGQAREGEVDHGLADLFWNGVGNLFFTKGQAQDKSATTADIPKLLSYKNASGWAMLSRGSTALVIGHGEMMMKVVQESDIWKEKGSFEKTFKEHYQNILISHIPPCCQLEIPRNVKVPNSMNCPDCRLLMEAVTIYKCCHNGSTAHH